MVNGGRGTNDVLGGRVGGGGGKGDPADGGVKH